MICPVSVIVPCFNSESTLLRAYNSIVSQTILPSEIIFIDDCSTDTTIDIILSIYDISPVPVKIVRLDNNYGPAVARNKGLIVSTQEYVAFLDSDDTWHPSKIELQYAAIRRSNAIICGHQVIEFDLSSNSTSSLGNNKINRDATIINIGFSRLLFKNYFSTPSVMLRRDSGFLFDESMLRCEDYKLWLEIAFKKYKCIYMDCACAYVHKNFYGSAGLSKGLTIMERYEIRALSSFFGRANNLLIISAILFSIIKFFVRVFNAKIKIYLPNF